MKFTIVTPTCNSARYLAETMASVVTQAGDFAIEYIVVDNLSSDATVAIVERFQNDAHQLKKCGGPLQIRLLREADRGMYEAINHGFSVATGEIHAWINSDDLYLPGAFAAVAEAFRLGEEIRWLKGVTAYVDEQGRMLDPGRCWLYSRKLLRLGVHGCEAHFVQQDSVFWRASLWRAAGGADAALRLAGDYDLWMKFARHAPLYSLNRPVSCFRRVKGQLSENLAAYREEQKRIPRRLALPLSVLVRIYAGLEPAVPPCLKGILFRMLCPFEAPYLIERDGAGCLRISRPFRCVG